MSSRADFVPQTHAQAGDAPYVADPMETLASSDNADADGSTMPLKIDGAHVHGAGAMSSGSLNVSSGSMAGLGSRSSNDHTDREIDAAVAIVSGWGPLPPSQDSNTLAAGKGAAVGQGVGGKTARRVMPVKPRNMSFGDDASPSYLHDSKMLPPAYTFPSDRRADGASPPPTTLRLTIDKGIVVTREQPKTVSADGVDGHGAPADDGTQEQELPASLTQALGSGSDELGSASLDSRLMASESYPASQGPLAPTSRYPYPEIRPLYSNRMHTPLSGSFSRRPPASADTDEDDDSQLDGMVFGLPSVAELAHNGMGGMIHATEQGWGPSPAMVRRPPFVGPPSSAPPMPMADPRRHHGGYEYNGMSPPTARRPMRYEPPSMYPGPPEHAYHASSSGHDLDTSYGQPPRQARADGGASRLFSLLNVCEELIEQIEREDRRKAREMWRYKTDVWGKALMPVKKKHINDARYYDSEDSDYEHPASMSDEAAMSRMLDIDSLCKRSTARNFPKHHATAWKIIRKTKPRRNGGSGGKFSTTAAYMGESDDGRNPPVVRRKQVWRDDGFVYQHKAHAVKPKKKTTIRIPGVFEPKRNSTALHESYTREADGTLTCARCGKGGFVATLGLRSHLSHCPGTRKAKEERKRLLAIYVALGGDAAKFDGKEEERFRALEADGKLPAAPSAAPPSADLGSPSLLGLGGSGHAYPDTRMPVLSGPSHLNSGYDSDGYGGVCMGSEELGMPLVPHEVMDGEALVTRVVSIRVPDTGRWEDVTLTRYRGRNNTHQFALRDGRIVWTTLTTHNCRLEHGYRGPRAPLAGTILAATPSGPLPGDVTPSRMHRDMGNGGGSSDAESDDNSGSSARRRSARNGDGTPAGGEAEGLRGIGLNAFYQEQEKLISRKGKRKAGQDSAAGSAANSDAEDGDMKVRIRTEMVQDNLSGARAKMRVTGMDHPNRYTLMSGGMPYQPHPKAPARQMQQGPPRRYGMPGGMGSQSLMNDNGPNADGQFSCRRCHGSFSNKQRLGWHTRRNECPGTPPTVPLPSSLAPPPSAPPALQLLASTSMQEMSMQSMPPQSIAHRHADEDNMAGRAGTGEYGMEMESSVMKRAHEDREEEDEEEEEEEEGHQAKRNRNP